MRAVGRNIRRDRVANILNGIERRGSSKEKVVVAQQPVRVFLESFGKLRSRFGGLRQRGARFLERLPHKPSTIRPVRSAHQPNVCLQNRASRPPQAARQSKHRELQCDPLVCASCCCVQRERGPEPKLPTLPHLTPSSDHFLTTTPSINPPTPLNLPRPVSLSIRPTCPTTSAFPSPSSSSQVRFARARPPANSLGKKT
jgi:hypothetical protein